MAEDGMGMQAFTSSGDEAGQSGVSKSTIGKITGHKGPNATLPKFYIDTPTVDHFKKSV